MSVAITGISAVSCLGNTLSEHADNMSSGISGLKPLSKLFGDSSPYAELSAGWIEDRSLLNSRKWAPGSALSLHVAKEAILDAGLTHHDLSQAAIFVGSSRGNVAGWISPWPGRRPFKLMAASNSMHGELASAISIELGITGPWQVIASGCAASLDALGMAWLMIKHGIVKHAIVTGVELPLTPTVLDMYTNTGVLSTNGVNDPYSQSTSGFFPGEAGAAIVLESVDSLHERQLAIESTYPGGHLTSSSSPESIASSYLQMTGYWCNSDAASPIGMPTDGAGLRDCLHHALSDLCDAPHPTSSPTHPPITAVCPHASGTLLHGKAELAALRAAFQPHLPSIDLPISLHPLKPYTGHTVGASGVLDTAILAYFMRQQKLPPNLPNLTSPGDPFSVDSSPSSLSSDGATVLKIAVGMGGHNSIVSLQSPSQSSPLSTTSDDAT